MILEPIFFVTLHSLDSNDYTKEANRRSPEACKGKGG